MATPIAHKGVVAGSKVIAMTTIDLLTDKSLLPKVKEYFTTRLDERSEVRADARRHRQTGDRSSTRRSWRATRASWKKYYYDPSKYETYLDQLGIQFPVLEKAP